MICLTSQTYILIKFEKVNLLVFNFFIERQYMDITDASKSVLCVWFIFTKENAVSKRCTLKELLEIWPKLSITVSFYSLLSYLSPVPSFSSLQSLSHLHTNKRTQTNSTPALRSCFRFGVFERDWSASGACYPDTYIHETIIVCVHE